MRKIDYIVVHCAATKAGMDIGVSDIDRWHRERGFLSCGYHYVIRRDGTVEEGRPLTEVGAHVRGYNGNSVGVCLAGGLAEDGKTTEANYTPAQWKSLAELVNELCLRFPQAAVCGHNDLTKAKTCPNFNVVEWWGKINR